MNTGEIDTLFQRGVRAIDAGDVEAIRALLVAHPELATTRLREPGQWLRSKIGGALEGFFREPYLLWFVAEDPVRNGTLPPNVAEVAAAIIDAAGRHSPTIAHEQLDHALLLVAWSWIARECGVQLALIDTLIKAGASPSGKANNALVNKNVDAARLLIARGDAPTLASAACLGMWDILPSLAGTSSPPKKSFALVLAALNGSAEGVQRLLALGADPTASSEALYPHGTPLHHAVSSGSLETVRVLIEAGAEVQRTDTVFGGTPRGWAHHYLEQHPAGSEGAAVYTAIAKYLRDCEGSA